MKFARRYLIQYFNISRKWKQSKYESTGHVLNKFHCEVVTKDKIVLRNW